MHVFNICSIQLYLRIEINFYDYFDKQKSKVLMYHS